MKKIVHALLVLIIALLMVSCATEGEDPTGLRGVWKATDEDQSYKFIFTSDGHFAYECYYEGDLEEAEFGTFECDESFIRTFEYDHAYSWDGNKLVLDFFGTDLVFTRSSKSAKNNTSQSKLRGVWEGDYGVQAFTANGTLLDQTYYPQLSEYTADAKYLYADGEAYEYLILNNTYYVRDSLGVHVFDRLTSEGKDQTSKDILVNYSPWDLVDLGEGLNHYIYTFTSGGKYTMEYYYEGDSERTKTSGTYKFSGHVIELSDDGELAYAIIDNKPFMFTI
jgi:hypothetical protein